MTGSFRYGPCPRCLARAVPGREVCRRCRPLGRVSEAACDPAASEGGDLTESGRTAQGRGMKPDSLLPPRCTCHGEPQHRNGVRFLGGREVQQWRCAVRNIERFWQRFEGDPKYRLRHALLHQLNEARRTTESARDRVADSIA